MSDLISSSNLLAKINKRHEAISDGYIDYPDTAHRELEVVEQFIKQELANGVPTRDSGLHLQRVSQRSELLIALLIENIDKFVADDNFVKMSNSYKKLKAIYCG